MDYERLFGPEDVALLVSVISANDSMFCAAHAVKLIEGSVSYPIESVDQLQPVFERYGREDGAIQIGLWKVTFQHAVCYLPREEFPIANRDELISRLLVGFETERVEVLESIAREQSQRPLGRPAPEE